MCIPNLNAAYADNVSRESPSGVLGPMRSVIDAVSAIVEDARGYDSRARDDVDPGAVQDLCERTEATLSNLVTASRTHATSYGLSPVSLLDAAMSHLSASITELTKVLLVRRSAPGSAMSDIVAPSPSLTIPSASNGSRRSPAISPSNGSGSWRNKAIKEEDEYVAPRGRGFSDGSSSAASPPPPAVFDTPTSIRRDGRTESEESAATEIQEGNWDEVKVSPVALLLMRANNYWPQPYVQTQSEQVITAIQVVLSSVRSPTPPPELAESLTQIITIVSSIVAVCNENLPSHAVDRGRKILEQLSDNCNKLSLVQASPSTLTKEARQQMAQSSFAIHNSVKELRNL